MSETTSWEFKGYKFHVLTLCPLLTRRKSIESIIDTIDVDKKNHTSYTAPTVVEIYKSDETLLKRISDNIDSDIFPENVIEQKESDLGLKPYIKLLHKSKARLFYDGISIRVTWEISDKTFSSNELLKIMESEKPHEDIVKDFLDSLKKICPEGSENYKIINNPWSSNSYYTINKTNWYALPSKVRKVVDNYLNTNRDNPEIRLADETNPGYIYFGEEANIHQIIAHDLFYAYEFDNFIKFFFGKINIIMEYQKELRKNFCGLLSAFKFNFGILIAWKNVKNALKTIYDINNFAYRGKILSESFIRDIVDKNKAFNNLGIRSHFEYMSLFKDGENANYRNVSYTPKSFFAPQLKDLKENCEILYNISTDIYDKERDVMTAFSTQFTLYAVEVAIIAIIIAIFQNQISSFTMGLLSYSWEVIQFIMINIMPNHVTAAQIPTLVPTEVHFATINLTSNATTITTISNVNLSSDNSTIILNLDSGTILNISK